MNEEYLYKAFEDWFKNVSHLKDFVVWDPREKHWFNYEHDLGFWSPWAEEHITSLISQFADQYKSDIPLSVGQYQLIIKRLKGEQLFEGEWNDTQNENLINGVYCFYTQQLHEKQAAFMFRYQIPRNYHHQDPDRYTRALFQSVCSVTDQPRWFIQFLIAMVHKNFSNEMFLIAFGPKGSGKSTLLGIPRAIFGPKLTSATTLYKLGQRFGLTQCYDKRVNINPDLPIKELYPDAVANLKMLTGGQDGSDGNIEIELKGISSFAVKLQCFFLFGCNQLPKFSADSLSECESIGRRTLLLECKNPQIRCPQMKELVEDPDFLDLIYSWLLRQPDKPIIQGDLQDWIDEVLERWFTNCDPLLQIIKELYRHTDTDSRVPQKEVFEHVTEAMNEENLPVPRNLAAQITQAMATIRIRKDTNHRNYHYMNIKRLYETEEEPFLK